MMMMMMITIFETIRPCGMKKYRCLKPFNYAQRINSNTRNNFTPSKIMSYISFKMLPKTVPLKIIYIYIYINLVTLVEGDSKAPFSIATTPNYRGGRYSFPWIARFSLDPYCMKQFLARWHQHHFLKSLVWRDLGLNASIPGHWRTLCVLGQWPDIKSWYLMMINGW